MCELCQSLQCQLDGGWTVTSPQFEGGNTTAAGAGSSNHIDALTSGYQWNSGGPVTLTYTYNSLEGHFSDNGATNYTTFNAAQQTAGDMAFQQFSNVANITFVNNSTTSAADTDIVLRSADMPSGIAGWAYYPNSTGSDITIDHNYGAFNGSATTGLEPGSFGFRLLLHEIGHAMGLSHPHDGNATLTTTEDSQNASVMSYNSSTSDSVGGAVATRSGPTAPQTLMIYDIAALQNMYGANTNHNAGDTTYILTGNTYVGTIWDGSGTDTLSTESYTGDATLDLREGLENVTTAGASNVWIAFGANVENGISGSGNDNIYGNDLGNTLYARNGNDTVDGGNGNDLINGNQGNDILAGGNNNDIVYGGKNDDFVYGNEGNDFVNGNNNNDIVYGDNGNDTVHGGKAEDKLYGGTGNDTLSGDLGNDILNGGTGADTFVFNSNGGADIIEDFDLALDIIQISAELKSSITEILTSITYSGGNATIDLGTTESLTVLGVGDGSLSANDFVIA